MDRDHLQTQPTLITSRNHSALKRIRSLQLREERERTGLFFVDGIRFVAQAVKHHFHIETLLVAPAILEHAVMQRQVSRLKRIGTPCLEVAPEVYHSISLAEEPQGIGAIVRQRWETLERLTPSRELCWLALETVRSPGNLGTILRTSDAVGGGGVILIGNEIDPYDSGAVRASMGALFSQRFVRTTFRQFLAWKRRHQCLLVGTSPAADVDYCTVTYRSPTVLYMGGERKGLSQERQATCDLMVKIPMVGASDSLNLAIATSVMLYEVFNQRRTDRY